jgi:hypothetical protein
MRIMLIIIIITSAMIFSGCGFSGDNLVNDGEGIKPIYKEDINIVDLSISYDCKANEEAFSKFTDFFQNKNFNAWCEDCKKQNGQPQASHDVGPFCNLRTNDSGKICTDSSQCQGACVADNKDAKEGKVPFYFI